MWNGSVKGAFGWVVGPLVAPRSVGSSRRRGPPGQDGAPVAQRGRTVLTWGWRLLSLWRCPVEVVTTRRVVSGGLSARLMFAGRDRRSAMRRLVPLTERAHTCGHSRNGGGSCCGGDPARGGRGREHGQPGRLDALVAMSARGGCHLGPDEAGELAGDRGDHDVAVGLAGVQAGEPAGQPQLRGPGPGHDGGVEAGVAAGDLRADRGPGLVGPRGLDQLGCAGAGSRRG